MEMLALTLKNGTYLKGAREGVVTVRVELSRSTTLREEKASRCNRVSPSSSRLHIGPPKRKAHPSIRHLLAIHNVQLFQRIYVRQVDHVFIPEGHELFEAHFLQRCVLSEERTGGISHFTNTKPPQRPCFINSHEMTVP
jgi:hypothetical protein